MLVGDEVTISTPTSPSARPVVLIPGGVTDDAQCLSLEGGKYPAAGGDAEGRALSRCNDDLLARKGLAWRDWRPMPPVLSDCGDNVPGSDVVAGLLDRKFGGSGTLVLKDPRLSRVLPYWLAALRPRFSSPLVLLHHCHPEEFVNSHRSQDTSRARAMLRWLANVLQAESDSRGLRRAITSDRRLRAEPEIEAKRLAAELGILQPAGDGTLLDRWREFLAPNEEDFNFPETGQLPRVIAEIDRIMDTWAKTGEDPKDYPRLDHALTLLRDLAATTVVKDGYSAQTCLDAMDLLWTGEEEQSEICDARFLGLALRCEQIRRLEQTISVLEDKLMSRDRELGMMARLLTAAESRYDVLFENLSKEVWQTNGFGEALSGFVEEVGNLRDRHFGPLREFDRLAKENSELHALVAHVEAERRAILESRTWRMTAPMRHFLSRLKRNSGT